MDAGEGGMLEQVPAALAFKEGETAKHGDLAGGEVQGLFDELLGKFVRWIRDDVGGDFFHLHEEIDSRPSDAIAVGAGSLVDSVSFPALLLFAEAKTLKGCYYGSVNTRVDFPKLLALYQKGKLDLDGMVTNTYRIDEAPQAFKDLETGLNARGVILYD